MRVLRVMQLERVTLLSVAAIVLAGCQTVVPTAGAEEIPSAAGTSTVAQAIPTISREEMVEMTPAGELGEPLAPLLGGASALLSGRRISIGEIVEDPDAYEGLGVQIEGDYIPGSSLVAEDVPVSPDGPIWGVRDRSGEIPVVGPIPRGAAADGMQLGDQVLVVGRVALTEGGAPYVASQAEVALLDRSGKFDAQRLTDAERRAEELAMQGIDVRMAQVYLATAQWLNLGERPEQANLYLNLALEMLENPERFKGLAGELPPRTPIHSFPTPPGTLVPMPESGGVDN